MKKILRLLLLLTVLAAFTPVNSLGRLEIERSASGSTSGAGGVGGLLMVDDSTNGVHPPSSKHRAEAVFQLRGFLHWS